MEIIEITFEEIKEWRLNPVTKMFFQYIEERIDKYDKDVHANLGNQSLHTADSYNMRMLELMDVVIIPDEMIDDLKSEMENM